MKRKILIIDDSKIGPILEESLKKAGHEVNRYVTGLEAITNIGESSYFDLALVDVGLPDMCGEKVIEYLIDKYPTKPVICITAYSGHQSRSAHRTIHKGSATKIKRLVEILGECLKQNYG